MARHKRRRAAAPPVRVEPRVGGGLALLVGGVTQSITLGANSPMSPDQASEAPAAAPASAASLSGRAHQHSTAAPTAGVAANPTQRPRYGYWELMLPAPSVACPQRALLLGLGGGTIAALLARRCPATPIVGVERDATVLASAYAELGLGDIPRLTVAQADAFAWVATQATSPTSDRYDLICLDLFEGGRLALGALGTPFLRQVASLLAPTGLLTVNLLANARTPDHLRRLEHIFTIEQVVSLYGNRVIHCRRRVPHGGVSAITVE